MTHDLTLPNVINVGAARCGTSFLHTALAEHPDVWCSTPKEINFFGIDDARSLTDYASTFEAGRDRAWRLESSPAYLNHTPSLRRLCRDLPDVKALVQLRDPLDRLWSHFKHYDGDDFGEFVASGLDEIDALTGSATTWYSPAKVLRASLYATPVAFLHSQIGEDRVLVLDYRHLVDDTEGYMRRVTDFLGVTPLSSVSGHLNESDPKPVPPLPSRVRQQVHRLFDADQRRLYRIIGWRY